MNLDPHVFVVLGATGDLYRRKLLPAIHDLVTRSGADIHVLGAATSDLDDAAFRTMSTEALTAAGCDDDAAGEWCAERLHYVRLQSGAGYEGLGASIRQIETAAALPGNRVLYLALPPTVFPEAISQIAAAGLNRSAGWTRLVIEKPFGHDGDSAAQLNALVHSDFDESQIYRIDHYLGKETVRNLLVFRFSNPIFEASWNRDRIERVEITVAEALDVGTRGGYYDRAGVVRDMFQSHLTQVLALVAMEGPGTFEADAIRDEKVKVMRSIRPIDSKLIALGQYEGYSAAQDVAPGSRTPTYGAVRLEVDNWRWQGVPFFLRTGKAMARRTTQIAVTFRRPPICLFHGEADGCLTHSNVLYLTLQPDEGFSLEIDVKDPGTDERLRTIPLEFSYNSEFGTIPDGYVTLLGDVVEGDQTLFVRADEVEHAWRIYAPILDLDRTPEPYPVGSWGPRSSTDLLGSGVDEWATRDR